MSRWILVVCVLKVFIGLLAAEEFDLGIEFGPFDLRWDRIGDEGGNDHSLNATLFTLEEDNSTRQGVTYGYDTRRRQYPFMASIMLYYYGYYYHICGGVIYDRHTVITAASCFRYIKYYTHYVGVGFYDLKLGLYNPGSQIIKVSSYTIHSRYDRYAPGVPYNIALLHLYCTIKYNSYVQPARLATKYDGAFANTFCYIVGYGRTEWGYPRILQHAAIYGINNYKCKLFWAVVAGAKIMGNHFCVYRYPISACSGDTGGPVVCRGKVVGLVSWGRRRCNGCFPTVTTRISSYTKWMKRYAAPK